jgi:acyl-coenzyme A synthetase/AMP-(fatty) acid ligase
VPGSDANCDDPAAVTARSQQSAPDPVERPLLRSGAGMLTSGRLMSLAASLASSLPDSPAVLNLCERRENFLVGFLALLMRGQACLLPPSRAPAILAEVMREHPGCHRLDDAMVGAIDVDTGAGPLRLPDIPAERIVVIGYTSGSTGRPKAHPKCWGSLVASTGQNSARLREVVGCGQKGGQPWIVATVPPQHMYGLEMSVLMPLLGGMGVHAGHPLYPADVAAALEDLPEPRVLVTTPVHLRALLRSGIRLPSLGAAVSATAPLAQELAEAVERRFDTALLEFFGSTETCVIASRRTSRESSWRAYPEVTCHPLEDGTRVSAPWFLEDVVLQDVLELQDDGNFVVRGRNADMVEVGGKRASLADLTRRLMAVPGVSDAVVFQLDAAGAEGVLRLAALVVAEGLTEADVLAQLAPAMDPVFLPRPLVLVSHLPRNDVGKLPREQLLAALRR